MLDIVIECIPIIGGFIVKGAANLIAETHFGRGHETLRIWSTQLHLEFDNICYQHRLRLKKPVIRILDRAGQWGSWDPNTRTICISRRLIELHSWDAVIEVLKHEIAHMIVNEEFNSIDHTHGDSFKRAAKILGISSWASASDADMASTKPGFTQRALSEADEKLLKRAQKLLALSESANEHEAFLAMKRVRELYSQFNLAQLESCGRDGYEYRIINFKKKRIPQHHSMIASILASHFFVEVIYNSIYDAHDQTTYKTLELMGSRQNLDMAEYIFQFLEYRLAALWKSYSNQKEKGYTARAKRSFYLGVLTGFDDKLKKEANTISPNGQTWSLDDVRGKTTQLIKQADLQLKEFVTERHPRLVSKGWRSSYTDPTSYNDGKSEGHKLSINKPIDRKSNSETLLLT